MLAIEPSPVSYNLLCKNVEKNRSFLGKILPLQVALYSEGGINFSMISGSGGAATNQMHLNANSDTFTETLDELFTRVGLVPNYIKLEAQGAELRILQGARTLIKNSKFMAISIQFTPAFYSFDEAVEFRRYLDYFSKVTLVAHPTMESNQELNFLNFYSMHNFSKNFEYLQIFCVK